MLSSSVAGLYQEPVPVSGFPVKAPVGWFEVNVCLVRDAASGIVVEGVGEATVATAALAIKAKRRNLENMALEPAAGLGNSGCPGGVQTVPIQ